MHPPPTSYHHSHTYNYSYHTKSTPTTSPLITFNRSFTFFLHPFSNPFLSSSSSYSRFFHSTFLRVRSCPCSGEPFFLRLCALVLCGSYCATFSSTYRSIIIPSSSFYSLSVSAMFAQMLSLFFLFAFWKFRNMCCCFFQTIISLT